MKCPICGNPMEIHELKTTYDKARQEFQHTGYRCRKDNVWAMIEIPKSLIPENQRVEAVLSKIYETPTAGV